MAGIRGNSEITECVLPRDWVTRSEWHCWDCRKPGEPRPLMVIVHSNKEETCKSNCWRNCRSSCQIKSLSVPVSNVCWSLLSSKDSYLPCMVHHKNLCSLTHGVTTGGIKTPLRETSQRSRQRGHFQKFLQKKTDFKSPAEDQRQHWDICHAWSFVCVICRSMNVISEVSIPVHIFSAQSYREVRICRHEVTSGPRLWGDKVRSILCIYEPET